MSDAIRKKSGARSDSTKALIKERALERGEQRSDELRERVRAIMRSIEKEMDDNEGTYPENKGALSSAEVARRAGVHPTTFFSPKQRELGAEVKQWLETLKTRKVVGVGPIRRELAERIADWKRLYDGLAQSHRDTELDLQQAQAELIQTRAELAKLQSENDRITKLLTKSSDDKVISMRPRKD